MSDDEDNKYEVEIAGSTRFPIFGQIFQIV